MFFTKPKFILNEIVNFKEKESLTQKVRALSAEVSVMERSLNEEENRSHDYEVKLRKAHNELQAMKNKYEQAVQESQKELLEERLVRPY